MGKGVEKTKRKKGRPSLLDLQKRNLKQQQEEELLRQKLEQQLRSRRSQKILNPNPNNTPTPVRRSTRRNPNPDSGDDESASDAADDDADLPIGKRQKEKKIKLVSKLPDSSLNSDLLNSGSNSNVEDDDDASASFKKRRIEPIVDRSDQRKDDEVDDKQAGASFVNPTSDIKLDDDGPSTPLPDIKLLLFIVDRLQKKDTYGVFAEPVDPEELPDYHEVIKHPMDFTTLKKKLTSGAYANLEQFEKDVFLLCSNAMEYNSADTIYFRQARSIQELAKKNFENLRQESDDNEPETKIVRRGRPPTKHLKRPVGRPPLERSVSDSPGATLATGGETSVWPNYDIRKASPDSLQRMNHGSRRAEVYISWSADKYDRADEINASMAKGISMKHLKKTIVVGEDRRNTYNTTLSGEQDPSSALAIFQGQHKHLVPVGLHTEYGFARSLARFAAKLGPVAWQVASKKIKRCLPPGIMFGPGWVGENDVGSLESMHPNSLIPESNEDKVSEHEEGTDSLENQESCPITSSGTGDAAVQPSFLVHQQQSMLQPCVNGVNGFRFPTQMGKLIQTAHSAAEVDSAETNPEKLVKCLSDQKAGLGPPDLNVGIQAAGSPSGRTGTMQKELVLQL